MQCSCHSDYNEQIAIRGGIRQFWKLRKRVNNSIKRIFLHAPCEMFRKSRQGPFWSFPTIFSIPEWYAWLIVSHSEQHSLTTSLSSSYVMSFSAGSVLAQSKTLVLRSRSSRTKGSIPRTISIPELSVKMVAHECAGPCKSIWVKFMPFDIITLTSYLHPFQPLL